MEAGEYAVTDPLCDHCDHPQSWHGPVGAGFVRPCQAGSRAPGPVPFEECACGNFVLELPVLETPTATLSARTKNANARWRELREALVKLQGMDWLGEDIQQDLTYLESQVNALEERTERRHD